MRKLHSAAELLKKLFSRRYVLFLLITSLLICAGYLLTLSRSIADWYLDQIDPYLKAGFSKVLYLVPVPVRELLDVTGPVLGALFVLCLILLIFLRKRAGYRRFMLLYFRAVLAVVLILFVMPNPFSNLKTRSSVLGIPQYEPGTYDLSEVTAVWNSYVTEINRLMNEAERDEHHHLIRRSEDEVRAALTQARVMVSAQYPRFRVDPPAVKDSMFPAVMKSLGVSAYTTWPGGEIYMRSIMRSKGTFAAIYAHEFSHFCGFHREDEANYLSFLLCRNCDDSNIRYSAYLKNYFYLNEALSYAFFGKKDVTEEEYQSDAYNEFCLSLVPIEDFDLFWGDIGGNYTRYHEARGEEVPEQPDKPKEGTLPETLKKVVEDQGERHFEDLQKELGSHYYDGVAQLILDEYAGRLN